MNAIHFAALAVLWMTGTVSSACAQSQETPPPPQEEDRRAKVERMERDIRDLETALSTEKDDARRGELKKRLNESRMQLKELQAPGRWWGREPEDSVHERVRQLIRDLEVKLENPDLDPRQKTELRVALERARAEMEEIRATARLQHTTVQAKVTAVSPENDLVVLSAGRENGVAEGDEFVLSRGREFIGKVVIDRLDRDWASGRLVLKGKGTPAIGDVAVASKMVRARQDPRHRGGPPPDPESHRLQREAEELDRASMELAHKLRALPKDNPDDRPKVIEKLKDTVTRLFDVREKLRAREVELIQKRLEELTELLKKRKENRDAIIEKRVKQLSGEADELDW